MSGSFMHEGILISNGKIGQKMITQICLTAHDSRNPYNAQPGSPRLFVWSSHLSCIAQTHISDRAGIFFPALTGCFDTLALRLAQEYRMFQRLCTPQSPVILSELPFYTLIRSVAVSKYSVGQTPGLSRVQKCSPGKFNASIHHAINCSFRSFASILTHLITYAHPKYIKPPTDQPLRSV